MHGSSVIRYVTWEVHFLAGLVIFELHHERTTGVEPAFPTWKDGTLAVVLRSPDSQRSCDLYGGRGEQDRMGNDPAQAPPPALARPRR
jgi:hypothetical protein